jgi:hypothetical protein
MSLQYRQGDLFVQLETLTAADLVELPSFVIVAGEVTGHTHLLTAGSIREIPDRTLYLDLVEPTHVAHEDHNALRLGPGWWLVARQCEYTPDAVRAERD